MLYVGSWEKKKRKKDKKTHQKERDGNRNRKVNVNLFSGSQLLREEKNNAKQYLRGKQVQGSSPSSYDVLLLQLILGQVSAAGK